MTITTRTALSSLLVAAVALPGAASAAAGGAAQAPDIGPQKTLSAGAVAPATIPGTGLKKGQKLRSGQKLVYRTVHIADSGTAQFSLTCGTAGSRLRGLGPSGEAIFNLDQRSSAYVGKRSVKLKAVAPKGASQASGTMFALCQR